MENNFINGIILVNKESAKTSFQIINELRKIFGIKKIGHAGTLDKNATGLLIVAVGKATKLLKFFTGLPKKYVAEINFGTQTTTDDIEGKIIKKYSGEIDFNCINEKLINFKGRIKQIPPDYSAVHINGMRAYKLAEKNKNVELFPREVEIYKYSIISFDSNLLKIEIHCSSGTYIRAIARDLGILTGYYAHLNSLIRNEIGDYRLKNSYTLDNISKGDFSFIAPYDALYSLESIEIKEEFIGQIKNGRKIERNWFESGKEFDRVLEGLFKVHHKRNLLAIIEFNQGDFTYNLVF